MEKDKINILLMYVLKETIENRIDWLHDKSIFDDDERKNISVELDENTKINFTMRIKNGKLDDVTCFTLHNKEFATGYKVFSSPKINDISKNLYPKFQHLFKNKEDSILDNIIFGLKNTKSNIRDSKIEGLLNKAEDKKSILGKYKFW